MHWLSASPDRYQASCQMEVKVVHTTYVLRTGADSRILMGQRFDMGDKISNNSMPIREIGGTKVAGMPLRISQDHTSYIG